MPAPTTLYLLPYLAEMRIARFLTQGALAEKAGVSRETIAQLERGGKAKPATVLKIAEVFGVNPQTLLAREKQ